MARDAARSLPPLRPGNLLPARTMAVAWSVMALIALLCWLVIVAQSGDMGVSAGTMGMALPLFLLLWAVMMAAMMFPSVAPVAVTWARSIGRQASGWGRAARVAQFACGYLVAWTLFGLIAYGVLALTGDAVDAHPAVGRWIGAAAFLIAGLQQLGPLKDVCLRHCRSPLAQLVRYAAFRPVARDLRVGIHHGLYCVGCCWGLMLVLVPLGAMNIAAMAAVSVVIFVEKLWSRGPVLANVVGVLFVVLAVVTALGLFRDALVPGLSPSGEQMDMG
ncbi:DUF2182 domain-containing protein [Streptomyces sp. PCS3-D2]|uniref:DUF2182 domain-containing protein n=1 Tax=Streptomyces sp. PCS3-D2 TaxID=1460244 RepID=UPI00044D23AF|nr:DUF2182 domain-containing protein [Streptomyces sp. PCS3-D2]WKV70535.1 DUF2182 domain-containing protein [Streptomyces sp. PCS3-D2]